MDPHLLRTFVAVANLASFSAAARVLGYTQSAVSQHIAALESDLGTTLLHRRPVAPTEAGTRLLEHAGPLLLRLDAARADIARLTTAPAACLAVAASPLAADAGLARAIAELRQRQPRVEVTVRIVRREAVGPAVATGAVDLGLLDGMTAPSDPLALLDVGPLTTIEVAEQHLVVALHTDHPLARRAGLRLTDLVHAQWIDAPDAAVSLAQLRAAVGTEGFPASLRYEGTDVGGLLALVAVGHGLVVLPRPVADRTWGVVAVPVSAPRLVHRTELLHSAILDGAAAALAIALTAGAG